MRYKVATITAAVVLVALLANDLVAPALAAAQVSPPGRPPNDFGIELPGYLRFLIKLDHFSVNYGYLLVAFAWVVAFLVSTIWANLRNFFLARKAAWTPESWPGDP